MIYTRDILHLTISILACVGFLVASYIHNKKSSKKKLICPKNPKIDCDTVIHSDYSTICGVSIEILGMIYYACIALIHLAVSIYPFPPYIMTALFCVSLVAVLFSIYLVLIQSFVIRHWCLWCLGSACISVAIAILSYLSLGLAL